MGTAYRVQNLVGGKLANHWVEKDAEERASHKTLRLVRCCPSRVTTEREHRIGDVRGVNIRCSNLSKAFIFDVGFALSLRPTLVSHVPSGADGVSRERCRQPIQGDPFSNFVWYLR
jgi:hypothetical protein